MQIFPDLSARERIPELMDGPHVPLSEMRKALEGLGRLHSLSRTPAAVWKLVRSWASEDGVRALTVLDLACGRGDVLRAIGRCALREGYEFRGIGIDRSAEVIACAREASRPGESLTFKVENALDCRVRGCNVVLSTLFLHHLPLHDARRLLTRMAVLTEGMLIVHDVVRSAAGYALAGLGTRLVGGASIVREDGARSIRSAFTIDEVRALSLEAGLVDHEVKRSWPGRYELVWKKPQGFYAAPPERRAPRADEYHFDAAHA